ncbi:MAG: hypothetical protein GY765_01560, partial [bacterium]|nr:hypothetical protein [bacterium]
KVDFNYWGIKADRLPAYTPFNIHVSQLAEKYIAKITTIQPEGPYYIAGWSLGGLAAFEMVRQMEQAGESIALLALIDTESPKKKIGIIPPEFTLKSEVKLVGKYLKSLRPLHRQLKKVDSMEKVWPALIDYFREYHINVDIFKRMVPGGIAGTQPHFQYMPIDRAVYHFNICRTLIRAMQSYSPKEPIATTMNYFGATERENNFIQEWGDFCRNPITYHDVKGGHFSIFKSPEVQGLARQLDAVIRKAVDK